MVSTAVPIVDESVENSPLLESFLNPRPSPLINLSRFKSKMSDTIPRADKIGSTLQEFEYLTASRTIAIQVKDSVASGTNQVGTGSSTMSKILDAAGAQIKVHSNI